MADTRDLELRQQENLDQKLDVAERFRAVIVDKVGNRTGTGTIWRDENRREVWYQAWGSGNIGWALCDNIEPVIGLGVIIAFEPLIGGFEVIRDDPIARLTATTRTTSKIVSEQDVGRGGAFSAMDRAGNVATAGYISRQRPGGKRSGRRL